MEMDTGLWTYFGVLVLPVAMVCWTALTSIVATVKRVMDPSTRLRRGYVTAPEHPEMCLSKLRPSLTILLPCYLPNEQYILNETILHIITKLVYPKPFKLVVCYNTPRPLEYEAELAKFDGRTFDSGRCVEVLKVEGSTSKAQNLNAAIKNAQTDLIAIYDADHHPDPESLMISTAHLIAHDAECVQGSTYLRRVPNLLAWLIQAEFFTSHFVVQPALQVQSGTGMFGGSNAVWKTKTLKSEAFRGDVQTEDIELTTRMALRGIKICLCPNSRSGELPPASFKALYRQRQRWTIGWDQVSLMHKRELFVSEHISVRKRCGLVNMLLLRYLLFITTFIVAIPFVVERQIVARVVGYTLPRELHFMDVMTLVGFVTNFAMLAISLLHAPRPRSRGGMHPLLVFVSDVLGLACFIMVFGQVYLVWNIVLLCISIKRIALKQDGGWVVTERAAAAADAAGAADVEAISVTAEVASAEADASAAVAAALTKQPSTVHVASLSSSSRRTGTARDMVTVHLGSLEHPLALEREDFKEMRAYATLSKQNSERMEREITRVSSSSGERTRRIANAARRFPSTIEAAATTTSIAEQSEYSQFSSPGSAAQVRDGRE